MNSLVNDKRVLRLVKKMHKDSTLRKSQLKRRFDLTDEDISQIKFDERYGEPRYYRERCRRVFAQEKESSNSKKAIIIQKSNESLF